MNLEKNNYKNIELYSSFDIPPALKIFLSSSLFLSRVLAKTLKIVKNAINTQIKNLSINTKNLALNVIIK